MKIILILLALGVFTIGLKLLVFPTRGWTGFYYVNPGATQTLGFNALTMQKPKYQSSLNSFTNLTDCQAWALKVRQRLESSLQDVFYCVAGCASDPKGGYTCPKDGKLATFE